MLGYELKELEQTRFFQEVREEGREEGHRELVLLLLNRKLGQLSPSNQAKLAALSFDRLEVLGADLLDFASLKDLEQWFEA